MFTWMGLRPVCAAVRLGEQNLPRKQRATSSGVLTGCFQSSGGSRSSEGEAQAGEAHRQGRHSALEHVVAVQLDAILHHPIDVRGLHLGVASWAVVRNIGPAVIVGKDSDHVVLPSRTSGGPSRTGGSPPRESRHEKQQHPPDE